MFFRSFSQRVQVIFSSRYYSHNISLFMLLRFCPNVCAECGNSSAAEAKEWTQLPFVWIFSINHFSMSFPDPMNPPINLNPVTAFILRSENIAFACSSKSESTVQKHFYVEDNILTLVLQYWACQSTKKCFPKDLYESSANQLWKYFWGFLSFLVSGNWPIP